MRIFAKNEARPWGFTLIELLTVIAIIGVLATLISASVATAQRKGRKAVSISNLRQIALAFNLYLDDRGTRPDTFRQMTETKYLTERVLICPEDRIVKNWAGLLEPQDTGRRPPEDSTGTGVTPAPGRGEDPSSPFFGTGNRDVPHSYFQSFDYYDDIWLRIDKDPAGGLAACQLHGIGRQRRGELPSIQDYQGLVLRVLKDGSVISRQVFWEAPTFDGAVSSGDPAIVSPGGNSQLPLFVDPSP